MEFNVIRYHQDRRHGLAKAPDLSAGRIKIPFPVVNTAYPTKESNKCIPWFTILFLLSYDAQRVLSIPYLETEDKTSQHANHQSCCLGCHLSHRRGTSLVSGRQRSVGCQQRMVGRP
jgi:hypothetical protein